MTIIMLERRDREVGVRRGKRINRMNLYHRIGMIFTIPHGLTTMRSINIVMSGYERYENGRINFTRIGGQDMFRAISIVRMKKDLR